MSSRRPSPTLKRSLAIKRNDGEPLNRIDIQYDVLNAIFSDTTAAFTNPYACNPGDGEPPKVTFRDLYIKAILHSSKATKALKDKMLDIPDFAKDFAMLALLVNVGRINKTMSFFPEMKTNSRTYHPVPSLQHTGENLQDAPRIKHILKVGLLDNESSGPPQTPDDVLARATSGNIPSTSILNLMFVLSTHSSVIGTHFSQRFEFLDVFLKTEFSSASRARAFLWMCFNYLENPGSASDDYDVEEIPNPFAEPNNNTAPILISLTPEEIALENAETPQDLALVEKLVAGRDKIVKKQAIKAGAKAATNTAGVPEEDAQSSVILISGDEATPKSAKKKGRAAAVDKAEKPEKAKRAPRKSRKSKLIEEAKGTNSTPSSVHPDESMDEDNLQESSQAQHDVAGCLIKTDSQDTVSSNFRILAGSDAEPKGRRGRHRYSPYPKSPEPEGRSMPRSLHSNGTRITMLQHAWQMISTTDPLVDSDEEAVDESDHYEYSQRLKVVSHLARRQWRDPYHVLQSSVEP
ncbi:hypothetical protein FA15DRAFT_662646 [Coprinopsis marcescibilis]|uniref:Ino eighty subunit 1 n=1 Tax=Coprinopsis marcescibilis TaxID=230819 RepID=A0A5C3LC48_COPMA|nr:hypothetical protein FA15DRAFT_662646 [Coprinopsis marcescibilis]